MKTKRVVVFVLLILVILTQVGGCVFSVQGRGGDQHTETINVEPPCKDAEKVGSNSCNVTITTIGVGGH
jgi:hypothetical protein